MINIIASFPSSLPSGKYWADYQGQRKGAGAAVLIFLILCKETKQLKKDRLLSYAVLSIFYCEND